LFRKKKKNHLKKGQQFFLVINDQVVEREGEERELTIMKGFSDVEFIFGGILSMQHSRKHKTFFTLLGLFLLTCVFHYTKHQRTFSIEIDRA
jgi:hypothetical protein